MIKLFEMFSGYGGASWGLKKANIPYECIGYSEINKYACINYEKNFPEMQGKNYGDCTKIDTSLLPYFDLLTGGFPCQDVALSGLRDLSKGRTNLYKEVLRIAKDKKPKYLVLENVKGLLSMEMEEGLLIDKIVRDLKLIGYGVAWKILNSKDYGTPQNRERIWFVCKYGGWKFMEFMFPEKIKLEIFVKDLLDKDVPQKYNITQKMIDTMIKRLDKDVPQPKLLCEDAQEYASCITTKSGGRYQDNLIVQFGTIRRGEWGDGLRNDDVSFTLDSGCGHDILVNQVIDNRYKNKGRIYDGFVPTLTSHGDTNGGIVTPLVQTNSNLRKLTPKECFRLMGFFNDEIDLSGLSDTRLYSLAGNGWDINVVSKIFKSLFCGKV